MQDARRADCPGGRCRLRDHAVRAAQGPGRRGDAKSQGDRGRDGIGVDNVDLAAAREREIPVCNVPDYCIDEVADQTLAFVLALTVLGRANCMLMRGGKWGLGVQLTEMRNLRDLTVGVVGLGRIGREVVRRLLAFKCKVIAFDPALPLAERKLGCQNATLQEVITGQPTC